MWSLLHEKCHRALDQGGAFVIILNGCSVLADDESLSLAERRRANAFRLELDRSNFILGRTLIQRLLNTPGATHPAVIRLDKNHKPLVEGAPHFNLSHSGAYVISAVSPFGPIGVDIEASAQCSHDRDLVAIVAHPLELKILDACPGAAFSTLFNRCWTRKEAVLKAIGSGLTTDPRALDTRLGEDWTVIEGAGTLRVADVPVDAQASAAVAFDLSIKELNVMLIDAFREHASTFTVDARGQSSPQGS